MPKKKPAPDFAWISYATQRDTDVYISVDSLKRLYLTSSAAKLIGLTLPGSLIVGYDHANKRLIVAKPEVVRAVNVKPFRFDARRYCSAKPFIRALSLKDADLPLRFDYVGRDYSEYGDGAFAFQLAGFDAPDGGLEAE